MSSRIPSETVRSTRAALPSDRGWSLVETVVAEAVSQARVRSNEDAEVEREVKSEKDLSSNSRAVWRR